MIDHSVIAFTIAAAVLTLTPGNDTMLTLRNTISGNKASGFSTLFGVCSGLIVHGLFAALGISVILMRSAELFRVVKFAGAAYLIFLGLQSFRSAWRGWRIKTRLDLSDGRLKEHNLRRAFGEGFISNVLNPKVALFYLSFLPQFMRPSDPFLKPLFLASIHIFLGIIWLSLIVVLIEYLRHILVKPRNKAAVEAASGTVMIGLGIRLATQSQ